MSSTPSIGWMSIVLIGPAWGEPDTAVAHHDGRRRADDGRAGAPGDLAA
jgi:hypothetical protein